MPCDIDDASSCSTIRTDPLQLWAITLWNKPRAAGVAMSELTLDAPPEIPKIVMFSASPPKASALSRTHFRAAIMSRTPVLPESAKRSSRSSNAMWPRIPRR